eukprot:scaffold515901_cov48-Prasinocladus_malaysianus.AAC.1
MPSSIPEILQVRLGERGIMEEAMWAGVSTEAKTFLSRLLTLNPSSRPSAEEALKDPWMQDDFAGAVTKC